MPRLHPSRLAVLAALLILTLGQMAATAQTPGDVVILTLSGAIDPVMAGYIQGGLTKAADTGAQCVIITMDTPGGLDTSMRQIVQAILASPMPVITYVSPNGARAASAGLFVAYSCPIIAMAPSTNIGAAHPVSLLGTSTSATPSVEEQKAVNDAVAYIKALATENGHNAEWAAQAITESVSIPASEALSLGVVNLIAANQTDLLSQLDGKGVKAAGGLVTLHTAGATTKQLGMSFSATVLHLLVDPTLAYLLLTVGIWGLIAEFSAPGISAGGIIGVVCLILFGVSAANLPLNWAGLGLIGMSVALFILDIKAPSHGLFTAGGIITFVLGSLFLFTPVSPRAPGDLWPSELSSVSVWAIAVMTLLTAGIFVVAVRAGLRAQRLRHVTGPESLVGAIGTVRNDLTPRGTVQVRGELWSAVAEGEPALSGDEVRVVGWQGLTLTVRKVASAER